MILFDYRMKNWSGIGRYSSNLIEELSKIKIADQLSLFSNYGKRQIDDFKIINCHSNVFSVSEQIELPYLNLKNKIDLFHSPHFVFPIFKFNKLVLTIHDLTPLLFPEYFSSFARGYMRAMIWLSKFKADKIITVSKNTKEDLIKNFGFKENKIKVIYNGVEESYQPFIDQELLKDTRQKYNTGENCILYVGNIKPHKNIPRLLKALSKVNEDSKLIIVGKRDKAYDEIFEVIDKYQLNERVIFTGFVPDEDLILLYNAATLFVYPSLYEGFGLPPLEAMACGTPVITSNVSSLPEVVGDAAITINPYNIEELSDSINKVLSSKELQQELSQKGLERSKEFTWRRTAEETLKVYEELLKG
ncbi:hypothetical protein U472_14640 [Orenia metallireducens]|uniref:Uncharacterized protein n=1 Tax=Orenia metallireducens TaxID=1413210 RepID=A0A1C0A643_9FIRM|nr:glycosyltransferase family 1 protein [Orenia metallireducens]OCL25566.1 hypothetical protein U472_14640 [Orenia metallireducens]